MIARGRRKIERLGFLAGEGQVPDDFDTMGQEAIEAMFRSKP